MTWSSSSDPLCDPTWEVCNPPPEPVDTTNVDPTISDAKATPN